MSYVRFSSRVRDECSACDGSGYVYLEPQDDWVDDVLQGRRLCDDCTSCWYIYWSVGDYLSVNHGRCKATQEVEEHLDFEDAPDWKPPEDCPMGDVALAAVKAAYDDWRANGNGVRDD